MILEENFARPRIITAIVEITIGISLRGLQSIAMLQPRPPDLSTSLERLRQGDENARLEILQSAKDRLRRLASKMLKDFPNVHRWEDTDDVFQNACMRLHRSLATVKFPSVADFFSIRVVPYSARVGRSESTLPRPTWAWYSSSQTRFTNRFFYLGSAEPWHRHA